MKDLKITILLPYYERFNLVKLALESIKRQNYSNWELFFCDDGSKNNGEEILDEFFPDCDNVWYSNTKTTIDEKRKLGGSIFGHYLNEFILNSDSDLCIFLCDDDALYPNYLSNLNQWYNKNNDMNYSYSHVQPFNIIDNMKYDDIENNLTNKFPLNYFLNHTNSLFPVNMVDASQVSWKTHLFKEHNVRFNFPQTANLDSHLYKQFYDICGNCEFNGFKSQYKSVHPDQLSNKTNIPQVELRKDPHILHTF
jgi:glycosyltransferase involved in cell wall biosynthesis